MIAPILGTNVLLASSSVQLGTTASLLTTAAGIADQNLAPQAASTLNLIERGRASELSAPTFRPEPSFFRRLTSGVAGLVLGGLILAGCEFRPGGLAPLDGGTTGDADVTMTDGGGGADGSGGMDGGGGMDAGPAVGPSLILPALAQTLPPTRAYLFWHDGPIPAGRTIADYEVCSTPNGMSAIDDDTECPNSVTAIENRIVLDPLSPIGGYHWKVRARFDDASSSAWSAIHAFSTDNSLVAWWRMNGNVTDSGATGLNGTLQNGAGFMAGLDGQALRGDGVNDYADMGNNAALQLSGPLTVSAWVNGNGVPTSADSGILNLGSLNYALTYHTNGSAYFYVNDGGNNLNTPMSPNAWHHLAGTFDGTTNAGGMKLYLDNVLAGMKTSSSATTGAANNLWIGRYSASYFRGLIDNVTLYNRTLAEPEVLNEFCATQSAGGVDPLPPECISM